MVGALIQRPDAHNVAAVAPYHVMLDKGQWREKLCHWLHKHVLFVSTHILVSFTPFAPYAALTTNL